MIHSPDSGVVVNQSQQRLSTRGTSEIAERRFADIDGIYPGAAAVELVSIHGREAARAGQAVAAFNVAWQAAQRPRGWTFMPALAVESAFAVRRGIMRSRGAQ